MMQKLNARCLVTVVANCCCVCLLFGAVGCNTIFSKDENPPLTPDLIEDRIEIGEATLGPGDQIRMTVFRHPELNCDVSINNSGLIFIPLAGEINVKGVRATELRRLIARKISKYINDPQVSTDVIVRRSRKITILGEVQDPGIYTMDGPIDVLDAIAMGNGFVEAAKPSKVILLRDVNGVTQHYLLDLDLAQSEGDMVNNPPLRPGDVIFVPRNLMTDMDRFCVHISNMLTPIIQLERIGLLGYDLYYEIQGEHTFDNSSYY